MLILSGYGEVTGYEVLRKGGLYTLSIEFAKKPSITSLAWDIKQKLGTLISNISVDSPPLVNKINIRFNFARTEMSLAKFIELFNLQLSPSHGKARLLDIVSGKVKLQEAPLIKVSEAALEVPGKIVAKVGEIAYEAKEKVAGFIPSLSTIKWMLIAAAAGVTLFYVGPLLRAAGTGAQRIVERIPEKGKEA